MTKKIVLAALLGGLASSNGAQASRPVSLVAGTMPRAGTVEDHPDPAGVIQLETISGAGDSLRAVINGQSAIFLFDTGEGMSTVTPAFAHAVGCRPWGQVTGFRMSGERLDFPRCDNLRLGIGANTYVAPIAGVFDIMSLLPQSKVVLAGSIGLDIFAGMQITIEPVSKRIVIESPSSFAMRIRHAQEIPARLVRDAEGVALAVDAGVPTKAGTAWMELDTGNGGTLVIGKHVANELGLDAANKEPQPAHFTLGVGIPIAESARVRDLIMDGNIGQRVLKNWNLTLDLAAGKAWLAPASS